MTLLMNDGKSVNVTVPLVDAEQEPATFVSILSQTDAFLAKLTSAQRALAVGEGKRLAYRGAIQDEQYRVIMLASMAASKILGRNPLENPPKNVYAVSTPSTMRRCMLDFLCLPVGLRGISIVSFLKAARRKSVAGAAATDRTAALSDAANKAKSKGRKSH